MDTDRATPQPSADINAPGWKWNCEQGVYLWWDGVHYLYRASWSGTSWEVQPVPAPLTARPHATRRARNTMIGLIITGSVLLVAGGTQVEEKDCGVSDFTYTDASGAWLPWLVLACVASFGVLVWRRWARDVRWIEASAISGVVFAAVTCPVLAATIGAMNCGL
jgi:hypothetical protein